jgi:hypothetical protein
VTVIGVTGHQGLPSEAVDEVQARLPDLMQRLSATLLVSSLAEGADQLCSAIALAVGVPIRVVVPSESYSDTFADDARSTYDRLLDAALSTTTMNFSEPTEDAFLAAGQRVADEADVLVAIWDGQPAQGSGGTADIVRYANAHGVMVEVIWPDGVDR